MGQDKLQLLAAFSLGAAAATGISLLLRRLSSSRSLTRIVQKPHPRWEPGQNQPPPYGDCSFIAVDPFATPKPQLYTLIISAVVPRPIAFVSSLSPDGVVNLSPFSYFNVVSHYPVTVTFGVSRTPERQDGKKDTLYNIQSTKEFVVNIMSDWFIESANHTCGNFPRGVDEMKLAGLTPEPSKVVKPPRVKESAFHMECKLLDVRDTHDRDGNHTGAIVLGEVVMMHVSEGVAGKSPTGKLMVDPIKLQPICRLGGVTYGRVTELFDIPRPVFSQ